MYGMVLNPSYSSTEATSIGQNAETLTGNDKWSILERDEKNKINQSIVSDQSTVK